MTKTTLFTITNNVATPNMGVNTITVIDFSTPVGLIVETTRQDDSLLLVRRNHADNGWEPVTDGIKDVKLGANNRDIILRIPDTYALIGRVEGTFLAYTIKD